MAIIAQIDLKSLEKMDIQQIFSALSCTESGLSSQEAASRLAKYGKNAVEARKESRIVSLAKRFWNPIAWMLEITAAVTYILGKLLDTYIILAMLIFNSIVGFLQENKATDAVEMLNKKIRVMARVRRDSTWNAISADELVPGDIVHVRMGDIVPADIKIISGEVLSDQSALTGESKEVRRGPGESIYSGSIMKRGEATGLVYATGGSTLYGKTTELVQSARSQSHLETLILDIVKYLAAIDTILVASLLIFSYITGTDLVDAIPFSLVVLIASIPVALPATFTVASAYGALDLARKGSLVTRLTAIEDAASMDTICFDKTGTLTQNRLTVADPVAFQCDRETLVRYALLASDEASQDSIDMAVIDYARRNGIDSNGYSVDRFYPFDPSRKRTEAEVTFNGKKIRVAKGAPQILLNICKFEDPENVMKIARDYAVRGYRTIGVSAETEQGKPEFCGLIPLHDPPREDSKELVRRLKDLGLSTKMITGDSVQIAQEISTEVGIGSRVFRMSEFSADKSSIDSYDAFAEVFPEDKYNIVKSLQKSSHITGMTGDGVNDAAALKQAEVGIAVATATDVAKASASIVLTHEGLSDIVSAVEDGRKIYQRMLTYTLNKIIKTVQVAIFLTISFFIYRFFVTTPFDVILLIFANDFVTISIATDNVSFSKKPEKWRVNSLMGSSISLAILVVLESFVILQIGIFLGLSVPEIHTYIFEMLVFSGQFTVYMVRERSRFWKSIPGKWLITASAGDIAVVLAISTFGILVAPVPLYASLLVLLLTFVAMALIDNVKGMVFRHYSI